MIIFSLSLFDINEYISGVFLQKWRRKKRMPQQWAGKWTLALNIRRLEQNRGPANQPPAPAKLFQAKTRKNVVRDRK